MCTENNELRGTQLRQDIVHILIKHPSLTYVQKYLPDLVCSVLMNHFILQYCKSSYIPGFPHPVPQVRPPKFHRPSTLCDRILKLNLFLPILLQKLLSSKGIIIFLQNFNCKQEKLQSNALSWSDVTTVEYSGIGLFSGGTMS